MDIETVGVVGCGLMGSGIAEVAAKANFDVVVREVSDNLIEAGAETFSGDGFCLARALPMAFL